MRITNRFKSAWNAFTSRDPTDEFDMLNSYSGSDGYYESSAWIRPDRLRLSSGNERSIVTSIYNKIALDVAAVDIRHVKLDENGRYSETIDDGLNKILTTSANKDQTGRSFIQDIVLSMLDEGCVACVPIDTDEDIIDGATTVKFLTMRTGKIKEWYPDFVKVELYNDRNGQLESLLFPKSSIAIIENPFYAVMNEPNSTLKRLIRKLNLLDAVDEQSSSGKLDLIIQLPYLIRNRTKEEQAEKRRKDIEKQLKDSKYGIAYTDGTEHITQLNRPVENNLLSQITYLTSMLQSQLGMNEAVLNGTADEQTMINYYSSTIVPVLRAITEEFKRKFLSKTAITQNHSIMFFRDPFTLVPVSSVADIADKFTRNEIMSSNEIRGIIGMKPSKNPAADELRNKNLNQSTEQIKRTPSVPKVDEINSEKTVTTLEEG